MMMMIKKKKIMMMMMNIMMKKRMTDKRPREITVGAIRLQNSFPNDQTQ